MEKAQLPSETMTGNYASSIMLSLFRCELIQIIEHIINQIMLSEWTL